MNPVCILGGGPAGCSAALAALGCGANVSLIERSRFPRHKVCGEFLSPGIESILEQHGLRGSFHELRPARIHRMSIHIDRVEKRAVLPEPAFGLSRYAFDHLLWTTALERGARTLPKGRPNVVTTGRSSNAYRGGRLFGFKAHFRGPVGDAVELFFRGATYVGINSIEDGLTNVCGLAPEEDLQKFGFEVESLIDRDEALRARLSPLTRCWDWIFTGPLEFGQKLQAATNVYLAGDALSFVDPFTGSGLLCAVLTGTLAGTSAARGVPVAEYLRQCSSAIQKPFRFSSLLRRFASTRAAAPLLRLVPSEVIFRYTRP